LRHGRPVQAADEKRPASNELLEHDPEKWQAFGKIMLSATQGGMTIWKETSSSSGPSGRKRVLDAVASTETSMMPDFLRLASVLREQMHATLSRSDALKPLAWLIVILTTTALLLVYATAPEWLLIVAACLLSAAITLYFVAFGYCLVKDRDGLRSETYSLHKIAIEHGLVGDSVTGVIAPETEDHRLLVQYKTESQQ